MITSEISTSLVPYFLILSITTISAQVGIGTTTPRGSLEVYEPSDTVEAPILVLSAENSREMSILQPNVADDNDAFTIATNNAFQFRVDANDILVIDAGGDVGINTTDAQADLHVAGATSKVRLDYLNSTNNILNNGVDPSIVMIDANGEFFLKETLDDLPINDNSAGTFFNTPLGVTDATGALVGANAYTTTITLTKKTLVEVIFHVGVQIRNFAGAAPLDKKPRIYGGIVTHLESGTDIIYNASSHTNALTGVLDTGTINLGYYTIGGNGFISLDPGVHTFELDVFGGGGTAIVNPVGLAEGHQIVFGGNGVSKFQIIYHN